MRAGLEERDEGREGGSEWLIRKRLQRVRPLLFRGDPESMHDRAIAAAERWSASPWLCAQTKRLFEFHDERLTFEVAGMSFPHPIGLAAGFDKSGRGIPFWEALGFGHVEIGSVSAGF